MKKLYFARHGESQANKDLVFAGTWDIPLTRLGRNQAKKEGEQARSLNIDCIVSSPLVRAFETAQIIADSIGYPRDKIVRSDLLQERNYGELQQKPYTVLDELVFEEVPGLETNSQLLTRGDKAVQFINQLPYDTILIVGHGTFGRVLRDNITKQHNDIEVPIKDELPNAKITRWL